MLLSSLEIKHDDGRPENQAEKNTYWHYLLKFLSNVSIFYKNVFHCHRNTEHNTLRFESKLINCFTWRRKQFPSEKQCIVLSTFMTTYKVLVDAVDITHVQPLSKVNKTQSTYELRKNNTYQFLSYGSTAPRGPRPPHYSRFRDHRLGRTPLDEWPVRRRDLYLTTHNTRKRQTSMPPAGFKPTIPASERQWTHALDPAATGIGNTYQC
jgi:hypothetical protein